MPSPFPGMDPYLESESLWPIFQHQLVAALYQILLPGLVDRYRARISERRYTTSQPLFTSVLQQEHLEESIEIRHRSDGRLVTRIEVISPGNRTTTIGRASYLASRRDARNQGASLVEIDLVLQGKPMLDYSREGLPVYHFALPVTRSTHPDSYEIYTTTLQKRLPRFKIPLADDDRDAVLDLQAAFTRSYDQAKLDERIDYRLEPPVPLDDDDRRWLAEWLTHHHRRD